jgi:hypothetical protein
MEEKLRPFTAEAAAMLSRRAQGEPLTVIYAKIREAANEGNRSISLSSGIYNDAIVKTLTEDGYIVTAHSITYIVLSW